MSAYLASFRTVLPHNGQEVDLTKPLPEKLVKELKKNKHYTNLELDSNNVLKSFEYESKLGCPVCNKHHKFLSKADNKCKLKLFSIVFGVVNQDDGQKCSCNCEYCCEVDD